MRLIFGHDAVVLRWAQSKWGAEIHNVNHAFGVIDDRGVLCGALMLHAETPNCVELSVVSEGSITPSVAKAFFRTVFRVLGYGRLQVRTDRTNKTIKRAAPRWGFKFEGTARDFFGKGQSALVFSMLEHECRWLTHEKPESAEASGRVERHAAGEHAEHRERIPAVGVQPG